MIVGLSRYKYVWATLAIAAITGILLLTPWSWWAQWVASAYAILIAARSARSMVRSITHGTWGMDVLAVAAIVDGLTGTLNAKIRE